METPSTTPEIQAAAKDLAHALGDIGRDMIQNGTASNMTEVMALFMEGVFTKEELNELGLDAMFQDGPRAHNLLEAIVLTTPRNS